MIAINFERVATVPEAVHDAHKQALVHRDVKPGNLLVGNECQLFVVGLGLALPEKNVVRGPKCASTLADMNPERAWGKDTGAKNVESIFGQILFVLLRSSTDRWWDADTFLVPSNA